MEGTELFDRQRDRLDEEYAAYLGLLDRELEAGHAARIQQYKPGKTHRELEAERQEALARLQEPLTPSEAEVRRGFFRTGEWEISRGQYHLIVYRVQAFGFGLDFDWGTRPCWAISLLLPFVCVSFGRHDWPER